MNISIGLCRLLMSCCRRRCHPTARPPGIRPCRTRASFAACGPFTLEQLGEIAGATLSRPEEAGRQIRGVAPLETATPDDVAFYRDRKYAGQFSTSRAGACLVSQSEAKGAPEGMALLLTDNPYLAYARVADAFYPEPEIVPGLAAGAYVDPSASVGPGSRIEANAVVGPGAVVGARCLIGAGAVIGPNVVVGDDSRIGSNATLPLLSGRRAGQAVFRSADRRGRLRTCGRPSGASMRSSIGQGRDRGRRRNWSQYDHRPRIRTRHRDRAGVED